MAAQLDLGVLRAEALDRPRGQQQRGRRRDAEGDPAEPFAQPLRDGLLRVARLGAQAPCMRQEAHTGLVQPHPAGVALEQGGAQRGLEPAQRARQRRLRLAGGARGRVDAAVLRHREEVQHLLQGHHQCRRVIDRRILILAAAPPVDLQWSR
ncbi:hypothetical protein LRS07_00980 [Aquabacterium sp. J223]|nr:hypothetical protein [Aquabacterium sp. J223]UUX97965.1 hypothetical protein LRS07_00980 [Aquabacterium sp. J223]